jgi:hypothetical protein
VLGVRGGGVAGGWRPPTLQMGRQRWCLGEAVTLVLEALVPGSAGCAGGCGSIGRAEALGEALRRRA